ncbi:MAG: Crp/Fnr family transcriptional regulator [Chakrabartia sp.]
MQRTYQLSDIIPTRAEGRLAELLRQRGRLCHFAAGALIQQKGDESSGFWLVTSGTISLCRFAPGGNVTIYGVLGSGDLFGELAYFAGVPRQVDAVADEDATLVHINAPLIELLLASEPEFARWLLRSISHQLRIAIDQIEGDRRLSAEQRLIRILIDMAKRDGPKLKISQQELGELIGVSRVTSGQLLRRLEAKGMIGLAYRGILVPDLNKLSGLADAL